MIPPLPVPKVVRVMAHRIARLTARRRAEVLVKNMQLGNVIQWLCKIDPEKVSAIDLLARDAFIEAWLRHQRRHFRKSA